MATLGEQGETPLEEAMPWGREILWAATERYAARILQIRAGARLSLHLHRFKDETLFVQRGRVLLTVREGARMQSHVLEPSRSYRIRPHTLHRLEALTDSEVLEVSTPYLDDVFRVEDDYGRAPSPDPLRTPTVPYGSDLLH